MTALNTKEHQHGLYNALWEVSLLCASHMAETKDGRRKEVDPVWPDEILLIIQQSAPVLVEAAKIMRVREIE